jgi:hypothetical protein
MNNYKIKIFNRYSFLLTYLFGVLTPYLYILFFINFKYIFEKNFFLNKISFILILFLFFQFLSTLISIYSEFTQYYIERVIAIFHNYINYTMILVAIVFLLKNKKNEIFILESVKVLFYFSLIVSIVSFFYSLYTSNVIVYRGLIALLSGIENPYTLVYFNSSGFLEDSIFPRTRLYAIYSNTAAICLFILSILYLSFFVKKTHYKLLFIILITFMLFTTGSRITIVSFLLWSFFYLFTSSKNFLVTILIISIFCLVFITQIIDVLNFINNMRGDSSSTRLMLYIKSLEIMVEHNIISGIGIKPYIPEIRDIPLGSHSTVIGYAFKNGIIGFIFISTIYFYIFLQYLKILFCRNYTSSSYLNASVFFLSIIFLFEDLDAYEFTSFLSGVLAYFAYFRKYNVK